MEPRTIRRQPDPDFIPFPTGFNPKVVISQEQINLVKSSWKEMKAGQTAGYQNLIRTKNLSDFEKGLFSSTRDSPQNPSLGRIQPSPSIKASNPVFSQIAQSPHSPSEYPLHKTQRRQTYSEKSVNTAQIPAPIPPLKLDILATDEELPAHSLRSIAMQITSAPAHSPEPAQPPEEGEKPEMGKIIATNSDETKLALSTSVNPLRAGKRSNTDCKSGSTCFSDLFYEQFFEKVPKLKANLEQIQTKTHILFKLCEFIVNNLDKFQAKNLSTADKEKLENDSKELAEILSQLKIEPEHYSSIGSSLLQTIKAIHGNSYSSYLKEAWSAAFSLFSLATLYYSKPTEKHMIKRKIEASQQSCCCFSFFRSSQKIHPVVQETTQAKHEESTQYCCGTDY